MAENWNREWQLPPIRIDSDRHIVGSTNQTLPVAHPDAGPEALAKEGLARVKRSYSFTSFTRLALGFPLWVFWGEKSGLNSTTEQVFYWTIDHRAS